MTQVHVPLIPARRDFPKSEAPTKPPEMAREAQARQGGARTWL
jgi:hypothetical protein